ncbi:Glu-tRNA(Gln) amidotransferase subunit GatE [Candidatus Micrarchaeota archaeon]|nr:Glu-tRNA(Gln) amidotransferase subunit GatE [Candidatus Micrarchaeota archaeon]
MSESVESELKLKCGIEVHQRLDSHKLFCNCPSETKLGKHGIEIVRMLHPVASELGETDAAAQFEALKGKKFVYQVFDDASCLVEADCEPPQPLNADALEIVLMICKLLECDVVSEVQVMRKMVIDGSNTAGFQRTAVVGVNGKMQTSLGVVGIPTVCIEEESAGIVGEQDGRIVYRLDRLGIPLVEIATSPDIKNPEHAREVAEKLGALLRATGKVQRGIGTIRQDLNVSVEGGARVEVKGVQDLKGVSDVVRKEAERQRKLVEVLVELKKRFGGKINFEARVVDVSGLFEGTASKLLAGKRVFALALPRFAGLLGRELHEGRRFGTELSDYAKGAGVKGVIHSDEKLEAYKISESEVGKVREALSLKDEDAFALVSVEDEAVARKALALVFLRAKMNVVPEETRKALVDFGSAYMRPLPGKARLYPETDVHPIRITKEMLENVGRKMPKTPEEKKLELVALVKNEELASKLLRGRNLQLFERIVAGTKADALAVAATLEETLVNLKREKVEVEKISEERMVELFVEFAKGLFVKAAIPEVLKEMAGEEGKSVEKIVEDKNLKRISGDELKKIIEEEVKDFKRIMVKYRLRVDASEVKI